MATWCVVRISTWLLAPQRIAHARARRRGGAAVEPTDLLAALVDESESRAATLLAEFGLDPGRVWERSGAWVTSMPQAFQKIYSNPVEQTVLFEIRGDPSYQQAAYAPGEPILTRLNLRLDLGTHGRWCAY